MVKLLKTNIDNLKYQAAGSTKELLKLLGIGKFIIEHESRGKVARNDEFNVAIKKLEDAETKALDSNGEADFIAIKQDALNAIDELTAYLADNGYLEPSVFDKALHGEGYRERSNYVDFALLKAEQEHIEFFKSRKSRFESQPHERLYEHYAIFTENGRSTFSFTTQDELPQYIQDDVLEHLKKATQQLDSL